MRLCVALCVLSYMRNNPDPILNLQPGVRAHRILTDPSIYGAGPDLTCIAAQ